MSLSSDRLWLVPPNPLNKMVQFYGSTSTLTSVLSLNEGEEAISHEFCSVNLIYKARLKTLSHGGRGQGEGYLCFFYKIP